MKSIVMFQTFDGVLHSTKQTAKRHLDNIYSSELSKVGNALMEHALKPGYLKIAEYVDSHLADFAYLQSIKDDMNLISEDDE